MAKAHSTAGNDWIKSQQQYWDNWFEQQRAALGSFGEAAKTGQNPWADFFREWQSAVSGGSQNADAFQQYFVKAGETYMSMLQQFYQGTGQAKPIDEMTQEWMDGLQKFYADALKSACQPFDIYEGHESFAHTMNKAGQVWASMLQPGTPDGKKPDFNFDILHAHILPGLGYTREKQEQMNALYKLWVEYRRATNAYDAAMAKVGLEAVKKFQEWLANPPKDQEPVTTLKGVYAKWVDACEDIYAKYAMTEEYTKLYGETVNALMAFKKQQNKAFDDMMEQFNMPTRQEVDTLHERLHALRRDNLQLRKDIAELKAALKPAGTKVVKIKHAAAKTAKKGKKK